MTTEFPTKEQAILAGIYYANMVGEIKPEALSWQKSTINQFGHIHEIEIADFLNSQNKKVRIGVGKFRRGYELWLIDADSGISQRV